MSTKICDQKYNRITAYITQEQQQPSEMLSYRRETRVQAVTQQEIGGPLYVGGRKPLLTSGRQTTIMITQSYSKMLFLVQGV